jgi:arylsulfatase A-like enzyme
MLLSAAAGLLAAGCAPRRENVMLIVIDTLRADRLGCYGHDRPTSPFIDQLAKRGVLFEQAYVTAPWTVPSTASLMTSLNARDHGCRHGVIPKDVYGVMGQELLPESFETLAERMKSLGYRTYGVSANPHVARETGFGQGFDNFKLLWLKDSPDVNRAIEEWSEELRDKSSKPWFLYIHYFDPHMPYIGREPWVADFVAGSSTLYKKYEGLHYKSWREKFGEEMRSIGGDEGRIAQYVQELRRGMLDLYDSEIAFVDQNIGRLFERLGIDLDQTTVIVTSDHGEEFFEHGLIVEHGRSLYEAAVRVPMIWSGPHVKAAPGTRIQTPVSLLDIFPTLAALNGGRGPGNAKAAGIPLKASLQTGSEPPERTLYIETERKADAVLYLAMRDGAWKYTTRTGTDGDVLNILIDVYQDPAEQTNLVSAQSGLAARFGESLQTWNRENPPREAERTQTHLDENRLREMRSLGYLK